MHALWYNSVSATHVLLQQLLITPVPQPRDFEIKQVPIPEVGPDDVLLKGI